MLYSGTDPESYITEYTLVYKEHTRQSRPDSSLGFQVKKVLQPVLNVTPSLGSGALHLSDALFDKRRTSARTRAWRAPSSYPPHFPAVLNPNPQSPNIKPKTTNPSSLLSLQVPEGP